MGQLARVDRGGVVLVCDYPSLHVEVYCSKGKYPVILNLALAKSRMSASCSVYLYPRKDFIVSFVEGKTGLNYSKREGEKEITSPAGK